MSKVTASIVAFVLAASMGAAQTAPERDRSAVGARDALFQIAHQAGVIHAKCCKHCSKGKACGDSCISRSKACHKGPGCACD